MKSFEAGPMDALHLLLQTLTLASKSASGGLQQLKLTECSVVNTAAGGRDGLQHLTSLALLRMTGEDCCSWTIVDVCLAPTRVRCHQYRRTFIFHHRTLRKSASALARSGGCYSGGVCRSQRRLPADAAVESAQPAESQRGGMRRCHCQWVRKHGLHATLPVGDCAMRSR
jgi:hypothetical protein